MNYKPINLFYNKYLSVRILFRIWLSEVKNKALHSNYEDHKRAKIAYEGTHKHKTTEYFYFGKVQKDHPRDPSAELKDPSQALKQKENEEFFESSKRDKIHDCTHSKNQECLKSFF